MPVRKIKPSKKYAFRGKEPTTKSEGMIHWESLLELDMVKILEFDTRVENVQHQPIRLKYEYRNKLYHYTPDFKVITEDGETIIVEVKPSSFLKDPAVQIKLEIGYRYCLQRGWGYRVVTEEHLHFGHLQENLDLLLDVRGYSASIQAEHVILQTLKRIGECSIYELFEATSALSEEPFYLYLFQLIYRQKVYTDLINSPLDFKFSKVRLGTAEDFTVLKWL